MKWETPELINLNNNNAVGASCSPGSGADPACGAGSSATGMFGCQTGNTTA